MVCTECSTPLTGRQTKFCSRKCQNASTNTRHQSYQLQQERGKRRKLEAIKRFGGCCEHCGYSENWAVLSFHHYRDKSFGLDLRAFSNHSQAVLDAELSKCELLCMNCHTAHHNPDCKM